MKLYIANKRYSSWSLRVWAAMKHFGIPFQEETIFLRQKGTHRKIDAIRRDAKLPLLVDGDLRISESLAILEYLAEKYPNKSWWPKTAKERALARSFAHEMHGGFMGLRSKCPMNCFARPLKSIPDEAKEDVRRIMDIWRSCLSKKKAGGYLFGLFGIVDVMFLPVAVRFTTYGFPMEPALASYAKSLLALPEVRAWTADAAKEKERIEAYEL
jgi:glutathione S-transferase